MAPIKDETKETLESAKTAPPPANGTGTVIPDWVTEDRFVEVLEENVEGFQKINKCEIGLTGGSGENYASVMIRVKAEVEIKDGSTKDVAYMIKTLPQTEQGVMMVNMIGLFPKEQAMYGKYLPEFEQMLRDAGKNVTFGPKFYRFKNDPGYDYVLLEDLSPRGFKNVNRLEGLDKEHTESVLRMLAELHAVSAMRYETKGAYDKTVMESLFNDTNRPMLEAMGKSIEGAFLTSLHKNPNSQKYIEKVKKLQGSMTDKLIELGQTNFDDFNVVIHGDLWANNIMFRYNDEGKLEETILVDFQISRYASPVVDLYYFLLSSTKLELKVSHFDYFVKYYHDHLVENLKLLSYPKRIPLLKEIRMQLLNFSSWGFSVFTGIMAAVVLDPSENANIDNFIEQGEAGQQFKMQMYDNPRYRRHVDVVLPWLDVRGLLDA